VSELRPLKILSIAHVAVSRAAGRLRYYPLTARRDLDLHLLVPARWQEFKRATVADPPDDPGLAVEVAPILLPHAGPANWYLHFYPRLKRLLRRLNPDVIHLWEEPWSIVALHAVLLRRRAAVVLEVDQNILKRLPPPFEAIRRFVLKRTDHILARSLAAAKVVQACGYTGAITPIGYGVDQDVFRPAEPASMRPSGAVLRIGYVGRVIEEKGLDDALDALAKMKAPATFAIMGTGPHEPALRARIDALGLRDRVTFTPWASPEAVAEFMRGLDVLVLLTRTTAAVREQFGRVILEAQSCGIPVIGSECGAIPQVVGTGGWIVPESDPATLAQRLDAIAVDPAERHRRGLLGQANVANHFTYEAVAEALADAWKAAAVTRNSADAKA
jgi:glycosyltransferase involved in cell wall biosynthesis